MPDLGQSFASLGTALGLGLLVGLQRQRAGSTVAGFRSFALATLLGAITALLVPALGVWPFVITLLGVAALVATRSRRPAVPEGSALAPPIDPQQGLAVRPARPDSEDGAGLATEIALLSMVCVGALVVVGPRELAVALGGCVMVLLQAKLRLHDLARRISDRDFSAIVRFALITLVILPVLPNRTFGPYDVFNPHHAWRMVVLIVGINLGAYVVRKLLGPRAGLLTSGILGGLVSSTATTASAARQARTAAHAGASAFIVCVASAVALPRVASVVALTAPRVLDALWQPLTYMFAAYALSALLAWWWLQREGIAVPEAENPAELRGALAFAVMFAVVLLAAAWAQDRLGARGLFLIAAIAGLTDVDAITLSTARMVQEGRAAATAGAAGIVIALCANTVFKGATALALGGPRFLWRVGLLLVPALAAAVAWLLATWSR